MFDGHDTEPNKMHSFESLFVENLAFSVINEDCYYYEGNLDTRPFAVLHATRMWLMHTIYRTSLHRLFLAFVVFTGNLFGANTDFTKLNRKELKNIEENVIKELQQLGI